MVCFAFGVQTLVAQTYQNQIYGNQQNFQNGQQNFQENNFYNQQSNNNVIAPAGRDEHYFMLSIGRYIMTADSSSYVYSENHLPNGYRGRGEVKYLDGFQGNASYLFWDNFSFGYDVITFFRKTVSRRPDESFMQEAWLMSIDMLGFEYYLDPILRTDTFGYRLYYGRFSYKYTSELFDSTATLDANYEKNELASDVSAYQIGVFYDYGDDDFGFRFGINYFKPDIIKAREYNYNTRAFTDKNLDLYFINGVFQIRYIF